jgi:predicted RecA/RadA family phage recombinase
MDNFVQEGDVQTLTLPSGGVTAGTPIKVVNVIAVPTVTVTAAEYTAGARTFEGKIRGVFSGVPKVGSQAWSVGEAVYWDDTNAEFTTVSTNNRLAGWATAAVGSGATEETGTVYLDGAVREDEAS